MSAQKLQRTLELQRTLATLDTRATNWYDLASFGRQSERQGLSRRRCAALAKRFLKKRKSILAALNDRSYQEKPNF